MTDRPDPTSAAVTRPRRNFRGLSLAERQAQRRELLLKAALELYGTQGFFAVTVRDICLQAGLTERYFYESFKNSEMLFEALYNQQIALLEAQVLTAFSNAVPEPAQWIDALLRAFLSALKADPRVARIVFIDSTFMREVHGSAIDAVKRFDLLTRQVLAVVLPSLKAQPALLSLMASGLNGFVMQLMVRWVLTDYQDREEDILRVCSLAFIGTYEHLRQLPER